MVKESGTRVAINLVWNYSPPEYSGCIHVCLFCDNFQITDGFALQLFRSNMAAISGSANLASFILPYVVTYILAEQHSAMLVRSYLLDFCKEIIDIIT